MTDSMAFTGSNVDAAAMHGIKALPQKIRKSLLADSPIILVVAQSGSYPTYFHQCTATEGIVRTARRRQRFEQMGGGNRSFKIEVPQQVLAAASPDFRRWLNANLHTTHATLDLGPL